MIFPITLILLFTYYLLSLSRFCTIFHALNTLKGDNNTILSHNTQWNKMRAHRFQEFAYIGLKKNITSCSDKTLHILGYIRTEMSKLWKFLK